jgi:hypothetical protein
MKKTTLIYLGVGAVAYYLWYQWYKKNKAAKAK